MAIPVARPVTRGPRTPTLVSTLRNYPAFLSRYVLCVEAIGLFGVVRQQPRIIERDACAGREHRNRGRCLRVLVPSPSRTSYARLPEAIFDQRLGSLNPTVPRCLRVLGNRTQDSQRMTGVVLCQPGEILGVEHVYRCVVGQLLEQLLDRGAGLGAARTASAFALATMIMIVV